MRKNKFFKMMVFTIFFAFILQTGFVAFSMVSNDININQEDQTIDTNTSSVFVSDEVKSAIQDSDSESYEKNLENYERLLIELNAHDDFKNEIETLILEGHLVPDILSAYEFLYWEYGRSEDIEALVLERESGKDWSTIIKAYKENNIEFIPTTFEQGFLEELILNPSITTDDIMIADRVSQKTAIDFQQLIDKKIEGEDWKSINTELSILNSQDKLPRVQITAEQIELHTKSEVLTEQQVIESYVLANRVNMNSEDVIERILAGKFEQDIYDEYLTNKYY